VARSAERIGETSLSIGQIHWPTVNYAPWQQRALVDGIADAWEMGYCQCVGVSNFGPKLLRKTHDYLLRERGIKLTSVQVQLSLLSRAHLIPGGVVDVARELGVAVIGYSPLATGVLSGKYSVSSKGNVLPKKGPRRQLFERLLRGSPDLFAELQAVSTETGCSMSLVSIAWCIAQDVFVIGGVRNVTDATDLMATDVVLTEEQVERLQLAASKAKSQMISNPFQSK
jgi:pyridoxine 4-dehydrogenase